jgi:hypothetical protein
VSNLNAYLCSPLIHCVGFFFLSFSTDEPTQGTSGGTNATQGATGSTTSSLPTYLQIDQGPADGTPVFSFSSLTDEEMAHLGVGVLHVEASPPWPTQPPTY